MTPDSDLPGPLLDELFPFHFTVEAGGLIARVGPALRRVCPEVAPGVAAADVLALQRPALPMGFENLASHPGSLMVVETLEAKLRLRGQVLAGAGGGRLLFAGAPWITDLAEMREHGITLGDFPPHSAQAASLFLLRSSQVAVEDARKLVHRLDATNQRLRAVLETAAEGIVTMDAEGTVRSFNAAASGIFGYEAREVIGRNVSMLMPEETAEAHPGFLARYLAAPQDTVVGRTREVLGLHRDGHTLALELSVSEATFGDERIFTGILRDLLERKRFERDHGAQVAIGRHLLRGQTIPEIWSSVAEPIADAFGFDVALLWLHADESGGLRCVHGWTGDPGRFGDFLDQVRGVAHPEDGPAARSCASGTAARVHDLPGEGAPYHREAVRSGLRSVVVFPVLGEKITHGAVELIRSGPLRGDRSLLGTLEAIGGSIGLAVERAYALRLAEESVKAREEFLAHMSHEIRTPLSGVIGLAYLLESAPLGEEERATVSRLRYSAEVLRGLVNNVLDFAKLTAGQLELVPQPAPLPALLSELTMSQEAWAREKGLTLTLVADPALPETVVTDPIRLTQILMNLVSNAIKYTETGAVAVQAKVVERDEERVRVRFSVADTGPGISTEDRERIFEAYTQAHDKATTSVAGTGLGLAIVRRLTGLMEGALALESEVGRGSTFHVTLPLPIAAGDGAAPSVVGANTDLTGLRVLVADDSEMNRFVASRLLGGAGADVVTAVDGKDAFNQVVEGAFDVVLMDIQMPEMDGYQATQAIREALGGQAPPIAALTARATVEDRQRVTESGMVDMITKPFHPEGLKQRVALLAGRGVEGPGATQPSSGVPRATLVHRKILMTQALEDPAFAAQLLELFRQEATGILDQMAAAVASGDPSGLEKWAHTLKSQAGTVGAVSLQGALEELESRVRRAPTMGTAETLAMTEAVVALGRAVLVEVEALDRELRSVGP